MFSRIRNFFKEHEELRHLAYHDSLTGLLNRNWLYKNIDKIKFRYFYVYFIDINDLHEVNKEGHTIGDDYIKSVVRKIHIFSSVDDIFIRYGGDEFILLSRDKNKLRSEERYAVGSSKIDNGEIMMSIISADKNMMKNKKLFKSNVL